MIFDFRFCITILNIKGFAKVVNTDFWLIYALFYFL